MNNHLYASRSNHLLTRQCIPVAVHQGSESAEQEELPEQSSLFPHDSYDFWPHVEVKVPASDEGVTGLGDHGATSSAEVKYPMDGMTSGTAANSDQAKLASVEARTRLSAFNIAELSSFAAYVSDPGNAISLVSPLVSGFASGQATPLDISVDSFGRRVPGRKRGGHAPHGAPDFMVVTRTGRVILIIEDKLSADPGKQLAWYASLFPDLDELWVLGCRVAAEPTGGLEFQLWYRDRTEVGQPLVEYASAADPDKPWHPWNSAHIHNKLRELAKKYWEDAVYTMNPIV